MTGVGVLGLQPAVFGNRDARTGRMVSIRENELFCDQVCRTT